MKKNVLITGGAGFIGSHLADELLMSGYNVRVFDNLSEQVHESALKPTYLNSNIEFIVGDMRDERAIRNALHNIDYVVHFASMVGVGQSMYQIKNYTEVNNLGTANLMEALIDVPVEKLLVASSMSIYGEGLYRDKTGNLYMECERQLDDLRNGQWEMTNDEGEVLQAIPTPEEKRPCLSSVYALSKYDQERLCLMTGKAYNIDTTALRFFNVYGTRQALSNPYTGVLAIFASRLLNNEPPLIYEDGKQKRDFVHVQDVARACRLALESPGAIGEVINIGSGNHYTIQYLAEELAAIMNKSSIGYKITEKYRVGDIRHCFADLTKAKRILNFEPVVDLKDGLIELAEWLEGQIAVDNVARASRELATRGLTV